MAPQNRGDAKHVCYGRPTNQAINQLAKNTKIKKKNIMKNNANVIWIKQKMTHAKMECKT